MALIVDAIERESETVWWTGEFHSWADHEAGAPFHAPGQLSAHGSLWPIPDKPGTRSWAISDGATVYPAASSIQDCASMKAFDSAQAIANSDASFTACTGISDLCSRPQ